ncbi:hypothetical protein NDU88_004155 [Pleurodeles waltl]|uniref:Uncharacterized protein n=1 Tax=Pleurodeles waltl TaxID=8319 RepID=A0AAV7QBS2_PLEWA|nr:hypothetical protein NDU88_004155 [Pleurodeles waltl]
MRGERGCWNFPRKEEEDEPRPDPRNLPKNLEEAEEVACNPNDLAVALFSLNLSKAESALAPNSLSPSKGRSNKVDCTSDENPELRSQACLLVTTAVPIALATESVVSNPD